jgi:glycosyltransferase involved in cell wall biosynthesis
MTTVPLPVSVVIPAYNRARMLPDAIRSVWAQLPSRPAEVVVVDDGSSDRTAAVATENGARVIGHERNLGAAAARNTGVDAAAHPWIALLDSDDEWLPHHLATLWRHRDGRVLAGGAAVRHGELTDDVRYTGVAGHDPVELSSPAQIVFPENPLPASGVLVRREAVLDAGGFDPSLGYAEDLDLWIRVLERGPGIALPTVVYRWNGHAGSKSTHRHGPREAHRQIVRSYAGRPWWSRKLVNRRETVAEWDDLRQALRERSLRSAVRSGAWIAARPTRLAALLVLLRHRRWTRRRSQELIPDGR